VPQELLKRLGTAERAAEPSADAHRTLVVHGRFDDFTGYGQFTTQLAQEWIRDGRYRVECLQAKSSSFRYGVPTDIAASIRDGYTPGVKRELFIYPQPDLLTAPHPSLEVTTYTMWESSRISWSWMHMLNRHKAVIVPNAWNASCFDACGVTVPIHVIQLGIRLEEFPFSPMPSGKVFTFGTSGNHDPNDFRKGVCRIVEAFKAAFPYNDHVRLVVKSLGGAPKPPEDPRVTIINEHWDKAKLAAWYRTLNCYVCGSSGEGWGLPPQEAMATGRPVIAPHYGGLAEFHNGESGWEVEYDLVPGVAYWKGLGHFCSPKIASMARAMTEAVYDREQLEAKGALSRKAAERFPIARTARRILEVI